MNTAPLRISLRHLKRDAVLALRRAFDSGDTQSWKRFHQEVRRRACRLLPRLNDYDDAVLVSGCQRSGTTMLARVITESDGMTGYRTRADDELDAALILAGRQEHIPKGRYCFQTTYLNESYREYVDSGARFRLIWVLRNPFSVVCSMKYNWGGFAFNELFEACGVPLLDEEGMQRYKRYGPRIFSRTDRACLSYNGKQLQAVELMAALGGQRMLLVDYDDLVARKSAVLSGIYRFIDLPYRREYADKINDRSVSKAEQLSRRDRQQIEESCVPVYRRIRELAAEL